jgi:hypothetical protein
MSDILPKAHEPGFWYLASPYSKYPGGMRNAYIRVAGVAAKLIKQGIHVYCPITHTHPMSTHGDISMTDYDTWLALDEQFIGPAKGIIVATLISWETSYGVAWEVGKFREQGKPVFHVDPSTMEITHETF